MHASALRSGKRFFDTYGGNFEAATVIDIGAQNINGSLKDVCPKHLKYVGVDFVAGRGVDVVLEDPYKLPFADQSADIVVTSSCFEHSEMFWVLFLELLRVLRPAGLCYLNAPSNGRVHRYPVDCWRFYPDSGRALATWAKRNGYDPLLLESFIGGQAEDAVWNDFVAVYVRDRAQAARHPARIIDTAKEFLNATRDGGAELIHPSQATEDIIRLERIHRLSERSVKG